MALTGSYSSWSPSSHSGCTTADTWRGLDCAEAAGALWLLLRSLGQLAA